MTRMTARAWRSWTETSIVPRLERPAHWRSEAITWKTVDFGMIGTPSGWLAQGLGRNPARGGGWFEAHMVLMPLYIPTEHPYFNWGLRLSSESGGSGFDNPTKETKNQVADDLARAINVDGLAYLARAGQLAGFRDLIQDTQDRIISDKGASAFAHGEELGYTELLLGRYDTGEKQLSRVSTRQATDVDWVTENRRRCTHILALLRQDPELALNQLKSWAHRSADALGIPIRRHGGLAPRGSPLLCLKQHALLPLSGRDSVAAHAAIRSLRAVEPTELSDDPCGDGLSQDHHGNSTIPRTRSIGTQGLPIQEA
jgi:hypothetical protein